MPDPGIQPSKQSTAITSAAPRPEQHFRAAMLTRRSGDAPKTNRLKSLPVSDNHRCCVTHPNQDRLATDRARRGGSPSLVWQPPFVIMDRFRG